MRHPKVWRRLGWAVGVVIVLSPLLFLGAETLLTSFIARRYPGVDFTASISGWKTITLSNVRFDRGWVRGKIPLVEYNWSEKSIRARGGEVFVDPDKKPTGAGGEHKKLDIAGLTLHVTKGDAVADLTDVTYDGALVTFKSGHVTHPLLGMVLVTEGTVAKDLSTATLGRVELPERPPMVGIDGTLTVRLDDVRVRPEEGLVTVDHVTIDGAMKDQRIHVEAGHLTAKREDLAVASQAHVKVEALLVDHPWISPRGVIFLNVETEIGRNLNVPFDVEVDGALVHLDPGKLTIAGDQPCQTWAQAIPKELRVGPLEEPQFKGNLAFNVSLRPTPTVKIKDTCTSVCDSAAVKSLKTLFTYTAYNANGEPIERRTGPGDESTFGTWTKLADITPDLPLAVQQMEDPGFRGHHGFISQAIENSLIADVKAGRFARGGSTITMQLAKNVWLRRDKTIGRKVEELLLSSVLESCFSKDEIMERYLNVVEFGPDVYGVKAAAQHYFAEMPIDLSPSQAFYLASILPHPRKAAPPNEKTMARMGNLMQILVSQGRIPDSILDRLQNPDQDLGSWERAP